MTFYIADSSTFPLISEALHSSIVDYNVYQTIKKDAFSMSTGISKKISNKYCPRFGQNAVEMGFITAERLKDALSLQVDDDLSGKEHRLLGTILFEQDWMSSGQIETVLNLLLKQMRNEGDSEK